MVRKFDAVIWNLYKHLWIFCCSAEYKCNLNQTARDVEDAVPYKVLSVFVV